LIKYLPGRRHRSSADALTEREHKVLLGVLGGFTNRKIGDQIGVSEGSVKASLQQLFSRTGVRTRSQLVRMALEGSLGNVKGLAHQKRIAVAGNFSFGRRPHG
jgi:DNA-binding NarL/FixJ family response regulator